MAVCVSSGSVYVSRPEAVYPTRFLVIGHAVYVLCVILRECTFLLTFLFYLKQIEAHLVHTLKFGGVRR